MNALSIIGGIFVLICIFCFSWVILRSSSYTEKRNIKRFRDELKPGDHVLINGYEYIVKVIAKNIGMVSIENVKTRSVMGEDIENVYPIEK